MNKGYLSSTCRAFPLTMIAFCAVAVFFPVRVQGADPVYDRMAKGKETFVTK